MDLRSWLVSTWNFAVSSSACIFTYYTVCRFASFLSNHDHLHFKLEPTLGPQHTQALLWNSVLVGIFCLQHSLMRSYSAAEKLERRFGVLTRSVYIIATCLCLNALMRFWTRSDHIVLWEVDTSKDPVLWWCFTAVHFAGWLIVYTGCLLMDVGELLGVKQVYYAMASFYKPQSIKARPLNRYSNHMRHPSFAVICLLFFVHPVMRVDRFLLAAFMSVYTFVRFNVDTEDYKYLRDYYEAKCRDMNQKTQ